MAAIAWSTYDCFLDDLGDELHDFGADLFRMALFLHAHTPAQANTQYGSLSSEHANQFGYTTAGQAMSSIAWSDAADVLTFDADDVPWTASGGDIAARYAVVYNDGAPNDPLVCMSDLAGAANNITVTTGNTLTVQINASGLFTISGGWT